MTSALLKTNLNRAFENVQVILIVVIIFEVFVNGVLKREAMTFVQLK